MPLSYNITNTCSFFLFLYHTLWTMLITVCAPIIKVPPPFKNMLRFCRHAGTWITWLYISDAALKVIVLSFISDFNQLILFCYFTDALNGNIGVRRKSCHNIVLQWITFVSMMVQLWMYKTLLQDLKNDQWKLKLFDFMHFIGQFELLLHFS